jgi:hypothetical protein
MSRESNQEQTALLEAWKRAQRQFQKKLNAGLTKNQPPLENPTQERERTSLNALIATIRYRASLGYLDLKNPAAILVEKLGAKDEEELTTAMEYLGYVRYYKLLSPETFYRGK